MYMYLSNHANFSLSPFNLSISMLIYCGIYMFKFMSFLLPCNNFLTKMTLDKCYIKVAISHGSCPIRICMKLDCFLLHFPLQ